MKVKKLWFVLSMLALAATLAFSQAQEGSSQDASSSLKDFTRSLKLNGVILNLVHLNDRTVEALFQPPTLYSIRARAKQRTMLYVQGVPQKEVDLTTVFTIDQAGKTLTGAAHNINHFEDGKVAKGERIDGILEFSEKVDLAKPFKVKNGKESVEFKFSEKLTESVD
ncbi:MAG: hypothetical protein HYX74_01140 [Acidobacteria bacterium]|nr:hypothetical protein [Acidobacteriota bacterium]